MLPGLPGPAMFEGELRIRRGQERATELYMTSSVTILLVDEEPILRRATALLLTGRGGEVSAVATLGEAIALTEQRIFDVAVIDVPVRGPSPGEIREQIRERGLLPRRLVVCLCAPPDRCEAEPFTAILSKPYVFEHLIAAVFGSRGRQRRPARADVFHEPRGAGLSRATRAKRICIAPSALAPAHHRLARMVFAANAEEAATSVELAGSGPASRLRGRRREAGAARAMATDSRRSLSTTFRGPRRAARARRGRE
jgi:CheY-like chemotaxis protein